MINYFIDFEFLEGDVPVKFLGCNIPKWLIKPNNTIQPISIGIVAEDGREYYAISKDFNLKEAWNRYDLKKEYPDDTEEGAVSRKVYWIRENVLKPIFEEWVKEDSHWTNKDCTLGNWKFTYKNFKYFLQKEGKTNKQISFEILNFIHGYDDIGDWLGTTDEYYNTLKNSEPKEPPQFYAYFADYDWVAFCWLFGKMIDLPKGFPKYCKDLKQMLDEQAVLVPYSYTVELGLTSLKLDPRYPKQTNEHNALADAKWNKELYKFIINLNTPALLKPIIKMDNNTQLPEDKQKDALVNGSLTEENSQPVDGGLPQGGKLEQTSDTESVLEQVPGSDSDKKNPKNLTLPFPTVSEGFTFGQKAVGFSFNPSFDNRVDTAKLLIAAAIDQMKTLQKDSSSFEGTKRHASIAITELESAQMRMVKAITWSE